MVRTLRWGHHTLTFGQRTLIMGILNVTPDSFSDGGRYNRLDAALARAEAMVEEGADIIDVGGESTRPGSTPVTAEEELARVMPVLERLAPRLSVPLSVDTSKAAVAERALGAGAALVNDVWGLQGDPALAGVVARAGVPVVVMHNKREAVYAGDLMEEIKAFLHASTERAVAAGLPREFVIVDPGFGFGKLPEHNLEVVRRLGELAGLGLPVLLGPSRKSTIGRVLDLPVEERLEGTAALVALGVAGGADIVRVHDVRAMSRVTRMADAVVRGWAPVMAYLGLGSNLGDRARNLAEAARRLASPGGLTVLRASPLYETDPVGVTDQPPFLNQVLEVETGLPAAELLARCLQVEAGLGRVRRERWGPRTLDIDILLYGQEVIDEPGLQVPHPRLAERAFVLVPLLDLAPRLALPDGRRADNLLARLGPWQEAVRRVAPRVEQS